MTARLGHHGILFNQIANDPYWANVVSLLHFNGADGSTTFTDETGKTWTPTGNAQIDTAISRFGGGSGLFDGNNDYLTATHADFALGTGDLTVEMWHYRIGNTQAGSSADSTILDARTAEPSNQMFLTVRGSTTATPRRFELYVGGSSRAFSPNNSVPNTSWCHLAWVRASGTSTIYINGSSTGGTTWADSTNYSATTLRIAGRFAALSGDFRSLNGHLDEFRITKGVARYTGNFSPPMSPFPNS